MKNILLFFCLVLLFFQGFSQKSADTIEIRKHKYYYQGQTISHSTVVEILQTDRMAHRHVQNRNACAIPAYILGFVGGGLIGWPLGTYIGGGEPEWYLAGIGGGLVAVGLGIAIIGDAQMKKAIQVFNSNRRALGQQQMFFNVGLTNTGFGFVFRF